MFFDPFLRLVDASRNDEARDAVIGYDAQSRLLFVVHVVFEDDAIRNLRPQGHLTGAQ